MSTTLHPQSTRIRPKDPLDFPTGRKVLTAFARYYYLSGRQLTRLLFADSSRTHTMGWLKILTNARLLQATNTYDRPAGMGPPEWVWSRTERGRSALKRLGVNSPAPITAPARKSREMMDHMHDLNDTLIALEKFGTKTPGMALADFRHDLDLKQTPIKVVLRDGNPAEVVPDGYIAYHKIGTGLHWGIALEVDRGTERRFAKRNRNTASWDNKVKKLAAAAAGPYLEHFTYESLAIAVVIRSTRKSDMGRLEDLLNWTEAAFVDRPSWAEIFRFTIANPLYMSPQEFVLGEHWIVPNSRKRVSLIDKSAVETAIFPAI